MTRKIDELGRIVLPLDLRRQLGVETGSELHIELRNNEIVLSAPGAVCGLCGSQEDLIQFDDSNVCLICAKKLKTALEN